MKRIESVRRSRTTRLFLYAVPCVLLAACTDIVGVATRDNGVPSSVPARVALDASVSLSAKHAQDNVLLQVVSSYLRANDERVAIATQSISLTAADLQLVAIPVDVATCVADKERSAADIANGHCRVMLSITMLVNNVWVDAQLIGPLQLAPGVRAQVGEPLTMLVIDRIELTNSSGGAIDPTQPIQLAVGSSLGIVAALRDDQGRPVEHREVTWTTSDPSVATVDQDGTITPVSPGMVTVTATFASITSHVNVGVILPPAAITVAARPGSGSGTITSAPIGISCRIVNGVASGACSKEFPNGTLVTLTSAADAGSSFLAWTDACLGSAIGATCQLSATAPRLAGTSFGAQRTVRVVGMPGDGSGRVIGGGIDCTVIAAIVSGVCEVSLLDGAQLQIAATPTAAAGNSPAHAFGAWGGACAANPTAACAVVANGFDVSISASFQAPRTLQLQLTGDGDGTVTAAGIDCVRAAGAVSGSCTRAYSHGTVVTLTATPGSFSDFSGWTGACAAVATPTCVVTMDAARSTAATFVRREVDVTVSLLGGAEGSVSINGTAPCIQSNGQSPSSCTRTVMAGTTVSVVATPTENSQFMGYGGRCTGTGECSFIAEHDVEVVATFGTNALSFYISGNSEGGAVGRIVGSGAAAGVDCRISGGMTTGTCLFNAPALSAVTLLAISETNSILTLWSGKCQQATTVACSFTAASGGAIGVSFARGVDVRMNLDGTGAGSVFFDVAGVPAQLPCVGNGLAPVVCRFAIPAVPFGQFGTFRAEPSTGSGFSGFTGACSNPDTPPFTTCNFRGIGFARDVFGSFMLQ